MRLLILCISLLFANVLTAQDSSWSILADVSKTKEFDPDYGIEMETLTPGILVQQMNQKEIEVAGYIIPLTGKVEQSHFMFSKFPQNMCFFCGKAGAESAMQVFTQNEQKVAFTQEKIRLKGILHINHDEASGLLYTLKNAELINE